MADRVGRSLRQRRGLLPAFGTKVFHIKKQ